MTAEPLTPHRPAEVRYSLHPRAAWTDRRLDLDGTVRDLYGEEPAVAVVRLPEGWPLMIHGAPARVWLDLADADSSGCTAQELAAPWGETEGNRDDVTADISSLLETWAERGLLTVTEKKPQDEESS